MAKVVLDPGHGGYDPGAVGPTGLQEKAVALQIAQQVGQLLQAIGIQVSYTRTSDGVPWPANVNQDLTERCKIANGTGADLFVSIHLNSGPAAAVGTETYCLQLGGNGEKAASLIQRGLVQALGLPDRGIKTANYYVLRKTSMPAVLTEVAFISNPREESLLKQSAFITKAAQAIAAGIAAYFGVALQTVSENPKGVDNMAIPAWKAQVVNDAQKVGLITQYHNPNEPADKAFVLAVALNLMKKLGGK